MGLFSFLTVPEPRANGSPNIGSAAFKANPYPFYARLRAQAPAYRIRLPTREMAWLITRYDDVVTVLRDERFVKDTGNALTPAQAAQQLWFRKIFKTLGRNMLDQDPPVHTRLRALVSKAFTPRLIEQMRQRVVRLTEGLLRAAEHRGQMDVIRDYALPLPTTIIAEMLGVPVADRHRFHHWSSALMEAGHSTWGLFKAVPNVMLFMRYLRKFIQNRRADLRDDLVSALIRVEADGARLSAEELLAMVMLLLVAGHETTVNLIGNGVLALLEHPAQMERLRSDPSLIRPAVEELLRFTGPVDMATERYAREDVTIAGATIPQGAMVIAVVGSANRDERQFPNPNALDIAREPNKHLAFGLGTHFCLGASLARLEGEIAISTLLRFFPDLRLARSAHELCWRPGLLLRGLESLPVAFGKTAPTQSSLTEARAGLRETERRHTTASSGSSADHCRAGHPGEPGTPCC
jgi:cytochrome P450 PksS